MSLSNVIPSERDERPSLGSVLDRLAARDDHPGAWVAVLGFLAVSTWLHWIRLQTTGLHVDAEITLMLVERWDVAGLLFELPIRQVHYPLYYLFVEGALAAGATPHHLKLVSVLASLLTVLVAYGIGRELSSWRVGVFACAVTALSPVIVIQGTWIRMYALLTLFVSLQVLSVAVAWHRGSTRRLFAGYLTAATVAALLHPMGVVASVCGFPLALWVFAEAGGELPVSWAIVPGTACLLGALLTVSKFIPGTGTGEAAALSQGDAITQHYDVSLLPGAYFIGGLLEGWLVIAAAISLLVVAALGYTRKPVWRATVFFVLLPLGILIVGSLIKPFWVLKYTTWAIPTLAVMLGDALDRIHPLWAGIVLVALVWVQLERAPTWLEHTGWIASKTVNKGVFG